MTVGLLARASPSFLSSPLHHLSSRLLPLSSHQPLLSYALTFTDMKAISHSVATALATRVFPVPIETQHKATSVICTNVGVKCSELDVVSQAENSNARYLVVRTTVSLFVCCIQQGTAQDAGMGAVRCSGSLCGLCGVSYEFDSEVRQQQE